MNTLLIVDDNELLRTAMSLNLKRHGFHVVEACDGAEAIAVAPEISPDIVLLDLIMPNIDGIETLRALRNRVPHAKFVMMSGGTQNIEPETYLKMALSLGAHAAIRKPFTNEQLVAALSEVRQSGMANPA